MGRFFTCPITDESKEKEKKMRIYAVRKDELERFDIEKMTQLLDCKRRQRINQIKRKEDRLRSIGAGLLLKYGYLQRGYTEEDWEVLEIKEEKNGKPYVQDGEFHFSLSHSGEWILCAVDSQEVGIDIEQIKDYREKVAERFFSQIEVRKLQQEEIQNRRELFYQLWTAKESYTKLTGTGLTIPLSEVVCEVENNRIYDCGQSEYAKIEYIDTIEQYMICVCVKEEETKIPKEVERLTGLQLLEGCYAKGKWEKCGKKG